MAGRVATSRPELPGVFLWLGGRVPPLGVRSSSAAHDDQSGGNPRRAPWRTPPSSARDGCTTTDRCTGTGPTRERSCLASAVPSGLPGPDGRPGLACVVGHEERGGRAGDLVENDALLGSGEAHGLPVATRFALHGLPGAPAVGGARAGRPCRRCRCLRRPRRRDRRRRPCRPTAAALSAPAA